MAGLAALLRAVTEGHRSRRALAARLGITDERLEERIDDLRQEGFRIVECDGELHVASVPEYGLGVQYGLDAPYTVEYHESIGSTNDRGRERARAGAADLVVLADRQTGGRGRADRSWSSPPGGIYMSVVVRPSLPVDAGGLLTLAAAVATVRAVGSVGVDAVIKWPNDVLLSADGRKLAGILTEAATTREAISWAVIGIGVNANVDASALPDGSASLRERVGRVDRRDVVHPLLEAFNDLRGRPGAIPDAWREHAITLGNRVRVETGDRTVVGAALDIDETGGLLVDTDDGTVRIPTGDCEHLRPA